MISFLCNIVSISQSLINLSRQLCLIVSSILYADRLYDNWGCILLSDISISSFDLCWFLINRLISAAFLNLKELSLITLNSWTN